MSIAFCTLFIAVAIVAAVSGEFVAFVTHGSESLNDLITDSSSACTNQRCSFVHALQACKYSREPSCTLSLPYKSTIDVAHSLADDSFSTQKRLILKGNNCTIRWSPSQLTAHGLDINRRFLYLSKKEQGQESFTVVLQDIIFDGFGHRSLDGGVIHMMGPSTLDLNNVVFRGGRGRRGGGIFISEGVKFNCYHCVFQDTVAVTDGSAVYIDNDTNGASLREVEISLSRSSTSSVFYLGHDNTDLVVEGFRLTLLSPNNESTPMVVAHSYPNYYLHFGQNNKRIRMKDVQLIYGNSFETPSVGRYFVVRFLLSFPSANY